MKVTYLACILKYATLNKHELKCVLFSKKHGFNIKKCKRLFHSKHELKCEIINWNSLKHENYIPCIFKSAK